MILIGELDQFVGREVAVMGFVVGACPLHIQRQAQGHHVAPEFPEAQSVSSLHQISTDVEQVGIPLAGICACRLDVATKNEAIAPAAIVDDFIHTCNLAQAFMQNM